MERNVRISPGLIQDLNQWFQEQPPAELRINLRRMLFDYLRTEVSTGIPDYYEDLLIQLDGLFSLLERADAESGGISSPVAQRETGISGLSLGRLMNYLADFVQPKLIFLRQSNESNPPAAFHYLTVILKGESVPGHRFMGSIPFSSAGDESSRYSVQFHSEEEMRQGIMNGDPYFCLSCSPDYLLFNPEDGEIPLPCPRKRESRRRRGISRWQDHARKARRYLKQADSCLQQQESDAASVFLYLALEQIVVSLVGGMDLPMPSRMGLDRVWDRYRHLAPRLFSILPPKTANQEELRRTLESLTPGNRGGEGKEPRPDRLAALLHWAESLWEECRLTIVPFLYSESGDIPIFDPLNNGK